jgi:hypothetical protein
LRGSGKYLKIVGKSGGIVGGKKYIIWKMESPEIFFQFHIFTSQQEDSIDADITKSTYKPTNSGEKLSEKN